MSPFGGFEIRTPQNVRFRFIKETKPLGMALVLSKVNMRSVDPILPLKNQNSNAFNGFLPLLGAFVLCSHGSRAACSPARHGPGDTPAVVPITDTYHKRHLPAQYRRRSEPERVRSSRRRVHVAGGLSGRPCVVYGGLPHTRTHSSRRRAGYAASARPVRVGGGACPWMWLCGRWRRCAEARRRRDAVVRQERRISR